MTFAPVLYVNNPISGTTYYAGMGHGAIPNSGTIVTCHVQCWNGPNGTGGLVAVSSLTAIVRNVTAAADHPSTGSGQNTRSSSQTAPNSTDRWMPAGKYTGGAIGSISIQLEYTGTAYVPAPSSFTPSLGGPGTEVTVVGNRMFDVPIVRFNGVDAASFVRDSETQLRAIVPSGATVGPIQVINETGTGTTPSNYIPYNVPSISGFSPGVGGPGTSVVITGSGFNGTTNVDFNGTAASFTVNSDGVITATVPNGATIGKIHVINPAGTATSATNFIPSTFKVDSGAGWDVALAVWGDSSVDWQRCKVWADSGADWKQIT